MRVVYSVLYMFTLKLHCAELELRWSWTRGSWTRGQMHYSCPLNISLYICVFCIVGIANSYIRVIRVYNMKINHSACTHRRSRDWSMVWEDSQIITWRSKFPISECLSECLPSECLAQVASLIWQTTKRILLWQLHAARMAIYCHRQFTILLLNRPLVC